MHDWNFAGRRIVLQEGSIVEVEAEALVNAANTSLILGSGVAGAIRKFGGPSIQAECNRLAPIGVGEAVLTGAGNLKAKHVIHAVGPVLGEGQEDEKLKRAVLNSLRLAQKHELKSIAFPAISTGVFGFPIHRCSEIMLHTTMEFLRHHAHPQEVIFCLFGDEAFGIFRDTLSLFSNLPSDD
jgi:O-acetyl-ADP-ribose deacetylase (regulator of RNase III)